MTERPRLVPETHRARRPERGYEVTFNRFIRGDRTSSFALGELSLEDLETLRDHLNWYLDEGRYLEEE